MSSVSLEEAQARLPQLLEQLQPGDEITITNHGQPLAQVKKAERTSWPCKAGSYRRPGSGWPLTSSADQHLALRGDTGLAIAGGATPFRWRGHARPGANQ